MSRRASRRPQDGELSMTNDKAFTVVITSDRYGAESAGLDRERKLLDQYPEMMVEVRG